MRTPSDWVGAYPNIHRHGARGVMNRSGSRCPDPDECEEDGCIGHCTDVHCISNQNATHATYHMSMSVVPTSAEHRQKPIQAVQHKSTA